jgi:hypothetical protein
MVGGDDKHDTEPGEDQSCGNDPCLPLVLRLEWDRLEWKWSGWKHITQVSLGTSCQCRLPHHARFRFDDLPETVLEWRRIWRSRKVSRGRSFRHLGISPVLEGWKTDRMVDSVKVARRIRSRRRKGEQRRLVAGSVLRHNLTCKNTADSVALGKANGKTRRAAEKGEGAFWIAS